MNRSQGNLQDAFLNSARRESIGVTIYLVSGVQLRGVIRAFDAFTLLLESQGRPPQMVYKHSIASVAPVRPVPLETGSRTEQPEAVDSEEAAGAADPGTEAASIPPSSPSSPPPSPGQPSAVEPSAVEPSAVEPSAVEPSAVEPSAVEPPEPAEREVPVSP